MATTTRDLTLRIAHVNGDTTSLKFGSLSVAGTQTLKGKIKALNTGTITINGVTKTVNYQNYLLSKAGSPAVNISAASLTETSSERVYTQGQE